MHHPRLGRRTVLLAATAVAGVATGQPLGRAAAALAPAGGLTAMCRHIGGFEISPLLDASGPFFLSRQEAFPAATDQDWEAARGVDPAAFGEGDAWELDFRCFVIRGTGDRLIVVDTGVGPDGSPAAAWAPTPGVLPSELQRAEIDVADVDTVVLTHLHEDHYGWSVGLDGVPMFPNARYVVQSRELEALPDGDSALAYVVDPLRQAGQLDTFGGAARLVAGTRGGRVSLVPTPGHTPGHQSVVIEHRDQQMIVTGDVLVHAVQLVDPDVGYRFEADPEMARRTRRALLRGARARRATLATAHLGRPYVDLG